MKVIDLSHENLLPRARKLGNGMKPLDNRTLLIRPWKLQGEVIGISILAPDWSHPQEIRWCHHFFDVSSEYEHMAAKHFLEGDFTFVLSDMSIEELLTNPSLTARLLAKKIITQSKKAIES